MLVFLLFYNFAFKELHYCSVCPSLVIGETAYQPIITGKWVFKNVTMFPVLYYVYDCNHILYAIKITVCHKNFITIHSLVYRLGYPEAIVLITLGYHKAIILLLLPYQCMNHCICK